MSLSPFNRFLSRTATHNSRLKYIDQAVITWGLNLANQSVCVGGGGDIRPEVGGIRPEGIQREPLSIFMLFRYIYERIQH